MLRTVDRLMYRELIPSLLFGVAAFTSLFFAGSYLAQLTNLLVQGVSVPVVAKLFVLYLPTIIVLTLPMSVLLSVLLTFSRLSGDSEMVALYAGGIRLSRLFRPVAIVAVCITLATYLINEWVAPQTKAMSTDIKQQALGEVSPLQQPFLIADKSSTGQFNSVVFVNGGAENAGVGDDPGKPVFILKDVTIITGWTEYGPQLYFKAAKARWIEGDNWQLYNGVMQTLGSGGSTRNEFTEWKTQAVEIRRTPEEIIQEQRKPDEMTFSQLASRIRTLQRLNEDTLRLEVDLYNKIAVPLASLVFALIAAPLGLRPHRGGSAVGFGFSIGLIFAYWMVWQYTSALAKSGHLTPLLGSFMANLLFSAVGIILLRRAAR